MAIQFSIWISYQLQLIQPTNRRVQVKLCQDISYHYLHTLGLLLYEESKKRTQQHWKFSNQRKTLDLLTHEYHIPHANHHVSEMDIGEQKIWCPTYLTIKNRTDAGDILAILESFFAFGKPWKCSICSIISGQQAVNSSLHRLFYGSISNGEHMLTARHIGKFLGNVTRRLASLEFAKHTLSCFCLS